MEPTITPEEIERTSSVFDQWTEWWNGSIKESSGDQEPFYICTAINYTNGEPHMGHAYEAVTADIIARHHRIKGDKTFFLTGSDEHGQKIAERAASEGAEPIVVCDRFSTAFQAMNRRLYVSNDRYIRTTEPQHYKVAQSVLQKSLDNGDIFLDKYSGWYNVKEEAFVSETDAQLSDYKDPSTGKPLVRMEEDSYFFKLSKYREQLIQHIKENPEFVQPETQRDFILKRLEDDLLDLSISRTNFKWGIPFPNDEKHVMYVWFDALTNYLTGIDYPDGENASFWPANVQILGKDIVWFHCVIWPAMLLSAGIPLPKRFFAHGFVNDEEGKKMSKSKGNVVDPHPILDKYPTDTFRLYMIHNVTYGNDLPFSETNLVLVHNADLADSLGNLVNRVTNITNRYFKAVVPECETIDKILDVDKLRSETIERFESLEIGAAYAIAIQAVKDINNYLTTKEPWKIKEDPGDKLKATIIRSVLEAIYIVSHFLAPFIPVTTQTMFNTLSSQPIALTSLSSECRHLITGATVLKKFEFKKFPIPGQEEEDKNAKGGAKKAPAPKKNTKKNQNQNKNADDQPVFTKLDLRVGEITKVWKHPESDKLWCEEIDVGEDEPLQVCSGLQQVYTLEEMQNTRCIVVRNLKPSKLGGVLSCGMVLCAKADGKVEFVIPPEGSKNGERIFIEGATGEPVTSAQVKKRKVWEEVSKDLITNDKLEGTYKNSPLLTSAGPCLVKSLTNAPIS